MNTKQLQQGWKEVELGDICEVLTGFAFKSNLFNEDGNGLPLVRIRDLLKCKSKTFYSGEYGKKYLVKKDDFLIGMDGEFKIFIWKSGDALLNQRVCKLILDGEVVIPKYIFYMISKKLKEIEDKTPFVTVKHISSGQIKSIKFLLPSIETQKQIVSILEKAEKLKYKRKESNKLTKEYLQSVFYEMFGDPILNNKKFEQVKLGEVCEFVQGINTAINKLNYVEEGVKVLQANNIYEGTVNFDKLKYITEEEFSNINHKYKPNKEDILYSNIGARFGYASSIDFEDSFTFSWNVLRMIIRDRKKLNKRYLTNILNSNKVRNTILSKSSTSTMPFISGNELKKIKIPLPPLSLQNKFASIVEEVEKLKQKQKQSKEEINQMFDSLMKQAFNGELIK